MVGLFLNGVSNPPFNRQYIKRNMSSERWLIWQKMLDLFILMDLKPFEYSSFTIYENSQK